MPDEKISPKIESNTIPEQKPAPEAQVPPEESAMYFNIMPKNEEEEKMLEPTTKVKVEEIKIEGNSSIKEKLLKYKLYLIIFFALIVLAPVTYFLVPKLPFFKVQKEEDLLVRTPVKKPEVKKETTSATTTPKEWLVKFWGKEVCQDENMCGDSADPDLDGLKNAEEFQKNTDPNNKDSDVDGLADGDEVHVFSTDPLKSHTAGNEKYSDADDTKGGYANGKLMTSEQIAEITKKMQAFGLNQPTLTTLGQDVLFKLYKFSPDPKVISNINQTNASSTNATSTLPSKFDSSIEAKQERDTQRIDTVKKVQIALVSYFKDNKKYPNTKNFKAMYEEVKPYLGGVATNPSDPVNVDPFVYTYTVNEKQDDFVITFYSEVANQVIKKSAADAQKESTNKSASFNDSTRINDLELLKEALLIYSQKEVSGSQEYVFPLESDYKKELVPQYISQIPKDPKTGADYEYKVSDTFDTFTLKAVLDNPKPGTTGYLCNQEECREY
jgi:hypothetical protein